MLSRRRMQQQQQLQQVESAEGGGSLHGVDSLIGGSGVSLDGQSLQLPDSPEYADDISSINTSNYGGAAMGVPAFRSSQEDLDPVENGQEPPVLGAAAHPHASTGYAPNDETNHGNNTHKGGCVPLWISGAPTWLKGIIIVSTTLLVGAIVLLGIAAALDDDDGGGSAKNQASSPTSRTPTPAPFISVEPPTPSPFEPTTTVPQEPTTLAPTPLPSFSPTPPPTTAEPTAMPVIGQTDEPTPVASSNPTSDPTATPTSPPSANPTLNPTSEPTVAASQVPTDLPEASTTVTFYLTAGRFQGVDLALLEEGLPTLPRGIDGGNFLVHLGDWNSPAATRCNEESYRVVDELYSDGPPTYFVVGDNEYNDCQNVTAAALYWEEYLLEYETKHWPPGPFAVERMEPDYPENFAFLYKKTLFIGLFLPGGLIHDSEEWEDRHKANMEWVEDQYNDKEKDAEALVVFAHADPDVQVNMDFYDPFLEFVEFDVDVPTMLIHRNLGIESWKIEPNFRNIREDFLVVVVEGANWPLMLAQVDAERGSFFFSQDEGVFNEFLANN